MKSVELQDLRHTASQVLAAAVLEVFPHALLVGGFATKLGFYYDFIFPFPFKQEFLPLIEEGMRKIIKEKCPLKELEMVPSNAKDLLLYKKQPLRAEVVGKSKKALISLIQINNHVDHQFFNYPHDTGVVSAFKLLHFSKREEEETVTRIIGTAYFDKEALKAALKEKKSLEPVDHQKIGYEQKLFAPAEESGYWSWLPRGEGVRQLLLQYWKEELLKRNFQFVSTPRKLISEAPFDEITEAHLHLLGDEEGRLAEISFVHDEAASGNEGLLQPKGFYIDQALVICTEETLLKECISSLQFILKIFKILSFKYTLVLCPNGMGKASSSPLWKKSVQLLRDALSGCKLDYHVDVEELCSLGPKIEVRLQDDLGREWSTAFVKVDCFHSQNLNRRVLTYSAFGSIERLFALIVEQWGGTLPFSLVPEQVRILEVEGSNTGVKEYITLLTCDLRSIGIRVTVDTRNEQLKKKMRDALTERVPFTVVIGEKELQTQRITVRTYPLVEELMSAKDFLEKIRSIAAIDGENSENQ